MPRLSMLLLGAGSLLLLPVLLLLSPPPASASAIPCDEDKFACRTGTCILTVLVCDGNEDCEDGSDELEECQVTTDDLPARTCKDTEFECRNKQCIPQRWKCDGEGDCNDDSDEDPNICELFECEADQFTCHTQGKKSKCIPLNWVCDTAKDCDDGSDELQCNATCTSEQFTCANGKCISQRWRCDGDFDCGKPDVSDEKGCPNVTCTANQMRCSDGSCIDETWVCDKEADCYNSEDEHEDCPDDPISCAPDEFACKDGFNCIRKIWMCDGDRDCPGGDDEADETCKPKCPDDQFMCGDRLCIPAKLVCNGFSECADKLDEKDCAESPCDPRTQFNCGQGRGCIPLSQVCDGRDDCGNKADEPEDAQCSRNECKIKNGGCEHNCTDTRASYYCTCRPGYMLVNGTYCEDINECLEPGKCSQVCHNIDGGHKCECVAGYLRDPNFHEKCKAVEGHASLLFAHFVDIRKISLDHKEVTAIVNSTKGSTALDFVFKTGMIFWTDVRDTCIYKAPIDEGSKKEVVVADEVTTSDGLAVDWIYNHIYWTETKKNTIEVADFNGDMRKTLIKDVLDEPRAIALFPSEGWMFWSDWGADPKIEKGGMDGTHRQAIITEDIKWPNAVTIDLVLRKIYWADAKLYTISSCNFDGSDRRVILYSKEWLPHPFSLTVFEDTLYWTDWSREAIMKGNKFTGGDKEEIAKSNATPMSIHVYHSYRQPNGTNWCTPLNGLCTHLCLPAPQLSCTSCPHKPFSQNKTTCACPDGLHLISDGLTCEREVPRLDDQPVENVINIQANEEVPDTTLLPVVEQQEEPAAEKDSVALVAIFVAIAVLLLASVLAYFIYRYFRKRSVHSMNFDNPVYKKTTTEDSSGLHLGSGLHHSRSGGGGGGSGGSASQYPHRQYGMAASEDTLEPLTNGATNFV